MKERSTVRERSIRIFLFLLGLVLATALAAALPAGASTSQTDAELLQSAAQEFGAIIKPYVLTLPDDTYFFHWTNQISKAEELPNYLQVVTSNYGKPSSTDDWEGPGLYLAQDPSSSITFGNTLVILKIRKGSSLFYINVKGATPFAFEKDSKIREWLTRKGQAAGHVPNFNDQMTPLWLSNAAGGGDLVRAGGVVGYLYDWNYSHAPSDCAQMTNQALDLIEPSAVIGSEVTTVHTVFETPLAQMKVQQAAQDLIDTHILSVDMSVDINDQDGEGAWKSNLSDQELGDYTAWKHAHLLYCQKPSVSIRFPDTVRR